MEYEMKNIVKFNHDYSKLRGQRSGFLCYAGIIHVGDKFPDEAYQYDTDGLWEFKPNTDYIQLVFLGDNEIPFTTYRNDTPENRAKYFGHEKEVFDFVVHIKEI